MTMKSVLLCSAICGSVFAATGCSRNAEEKALEQALENETGAPARVQISGEGVSVRTDGGETTLQAGDKAALPEDFPADVHVLKGAKIQLAMRTSEGFMATLLADDTADQVKGTYRKEMAKQGWTEDASINMGEAIMLIYQKNARNAQVSIAAQDGQTQVSLVATR